MDRTSFSSLPDYEQDDAQYAAAVNSAGAEQFASASLAEARNRAGTGTAERALGIDVYMAEQKRVVEQSEGWRSEVASRIEGYRQRRGRKRADEHSMHFDFEAPQRVTQAAASDINSIGWLRAQAAAALATAHYELPVPDAQVEEPASVQQQEFVSESHPEPAPDAPVYVQEAVAEPQPAEKQQPARSRRSNLITFPRLPFNAEPAPDELAESLLDLPRILDVPEELVQELAEPTPLADIKLETAEDALGAESQIEVPMQVAPVLARVTAAVTDWLVVGAACIIFTAIAWQMTSGLPTNKLTLAAGAIVPMLMWILYQYCFLVYGGATVGMNVARLQLRTFKNEPVTRGLRRGRAIASALSYAPLGLGLVWAFGDEDGLCWHDRMTHTHLSLR